MLVYYLLIVLVLGLGYPLIAHKPTQFKKIAYLVITFMAMFYISFLRYGIGNDYFSYIYFFNKSQQITSFAEIFTGDIEPAFVLMNKLIALITKNVDIVYGIYSLIILVPVALVIYKHSKNVWMSTSLFICLTFFYTSLSFIRQSIAVTIIFCGYRFIKERKVIPVILLILLASTFHLTALIMIPLYLIAVFIKPTPVVLTIYSLIIAALYATSGQVIEFVVNNIFTSYKNYLGLSFITNGFSWIYMILPIIFLAGALIAQFTSYGKTHKNAYIFTNFAVFNFVFWLFSTKHFVVERFSMYSYIFVIMFVPSIVNYYREKAKLGSNGTAVEIAADALVENNEEVVSLQQTDSDDLLEDESDDEDDGDVTQIVSHSAKPKGKKKFYQNNRFIYAMIMIAVMVPSLWYNYYGMHAGTKGFHGAFPYESTIIPYMKWDMSFENEADKIALLKKEEDMYKYLLRLDDENLVAFISVRGDAAGAMIPGLIGAFKNIDLSFKGNYKENSYVAIVDGGKCYFEEVSEDKLSVTKEIEGMNVVLTSQGKKTDKSYSSIKIDGKEKSQNVSGMNIVVYDKTTKKIVDVVAFKSYYLGLTCVREK